MKPLLLMLAILFGSCFFMNAQTLTDFNKNFTKTVEYDNDFNPTLKITLTNISTKTITSIEVTVEYGHDSYNWSNPKEGF